jgi:hypothetical protein
MECKSRIVARWAFSTLTKRLPVTPIVARVSFSAAPLCAVAPQQRANRNAVCAGVDAMAKPDEQSVAIRKEIDSRQIRHFVYTLFYTIH